MKISSPLAPVAASIIATVVFVALNGYAFGGSTQRLPGTSPSSDHANVLPQVYREYDAGLFSRDGQIQSGATFKTILWPIIGKLCPPERVNWAFFVLHIVFLTASFWLVWRLAAECCGSERAAEGRDSMMAGARMPIIVTPPFAAQSMEHPHPAEYSSGAFAGLLAIILFVVIRISPAAEPTLDTAFYTRGAALPMGLAAILLVLRGRSAWAGVLLTFTAAIHAITALQVICAGLPLALMAPQAPARQRRLSVVAGVVAIATLWIGIETVMIPQMLRPGAAWIAMQRAVNGSHLFVDLIPQSAWREFAVCGLFLLPPLSLSRADPLRRLALAALIGAIASVLLGLAGQVSEVSILLQLSPLRGLKLIMILSLVSAAVMTARRVEIMVLSDASRAARLSAVAGSAALLALVCGQHYLALAAFVVMTIFSGAPRLHRTISLGVAGALAAWFGGVDFARGLNDVPRTTWILGVAVAAGMAAIAIIALRAGRVIDPPDRAPGGWNRARRMLVSLGALGLLAIPAQRDDVWVYAARDYPWREPSDPWAEAQRWVAANTQVDSLFLVPPWLEGFRTYARRSEFVEYKQGTLSLFHPRFGQEWAGRMAQLTPRQLSGEAYDDMAKNYNALTPAEIEAIVRRYDITHVIVLASREDLPYRLIYQNALVRILDSTNNVEPKNH